MYISKKTLGLAAAALTLGLVVGLLVARPASTGTQLSLSESLMNASATSSGKTMAIATGSVSPETEALFILDYITGDLTCYVLYATTGQLGGVLRRNVVDDLGIEEGKQPEYLLVTGGANFRAQGNVKPGACVLYVADANSGKYVAYSPMWNTQMEKVRRSQEQEFVVLYQGNTREAVETE